jgi:hypothetical protein
MQTVCSKCFKSFESGDANFYYNKRQKRFYTWCKSCHQYVVNARGRSKKSRQRPKSSDPVEDKFIKLRQLLLMRHKRKTCSGEVVSTRELLNKHETSEGRCYYTNLKYSLFERGPLYMSVDRINSSLGYTVDNTVLCCWFVNCAKNEWPLDQMKELWSHLPVIS